MLTCPSDEVGPSSQWCCAELATLAQACIHRDVYRHVCEHVGRHVCEHVDRHVCEHVDRRAYRRACTGTQKGLLYRL